MSAIKLAALLICCIQLGHAAELDTKQPTVAQIESVVETKLTPSIEEQKSKTEKRDSSDQTANVYTSKTAKEASFRSVYPSASYYEAGESGAIFGPTTLRYTAADAAVAAAPQQQQQSFYEKPESVNSIRYVAQPTAAGHKHANALPGPLQFTTQQQHVPQQQHAQQQPQQPQPHRFRFAVPPQVELYQRPVAKPMSIYSYAESESPSLYERAGPHPYQLPAGATPMTPPPQQHQQQQQRFQYIIAIPLSYMRQLQQQLAHGLPPPSTEATPATAAASPSSPAPASVQLLGPLARDHQGMYRPYYQSDSASAPSAMPTAMAAYGQHYLQIPANVLLAAAQQLQLQQQHALYPKSTATPSGIQYTPIVYQPQPQPAPHQLQLQRIYHHAPPPPTIYAEQPQASALYAYPLHQQQHHHQPQQQQQQARLFRLGLKQTQQQQQQHQYVAAPSAATPSAPAPATTAATTTTLVLPPATAGAHEQQQQQQQHQALPIVHYNPIYVQSPAEHQQQHQHHPQQQQHQFAILPRFSNNNPKAAYNLAHESTPPIHVVRLSAANALGHQQQHHQQQPQTTTIQHFQLQQPYQQQQQQFYHHTHPNYVEEQQQHQQHSHSPVSPAIIPYFSHPGAVHYGTHLYHPAAAVATASATSTKQQQQQQQQQQRLVAATTATSGRQPGDNGAGIAGVKQPTAAANIVKYP